MTNNEILAAADEFIDDSISETIRIALANQAKGKLEAELHLEESPAIAADDNTSLAWPEQFHLLIAMEMAKIWYAIDQGEKSRSYAPEWQAFYNDLKNSFSDHLAQERLAAIGSATPYEVDSII